MIGADQPEFNLTYPVFLIVRYGSGVKGSLTSVLDENDKMNTAFRNKFIYYSQAKKAKSKADDTGAGGGTGGNTGTGTDTSGAGTR